MADHPVQFTPLAPDAPSYAGGVRLVACDLCGAVVADTDRWRDVHRRNHDAHNGVHRDLRFQAGQHVPAPTYRGYVP